MKTLKTIISIILLTVILAGSITFFSCKSGNSSKTINISGAFALYPMAVKWAEEYKKVRPDIQINLSAGGAGKGMTDALSKMVELGMVSRSISKEETAKGAWPVGVVIDAVVPSINSANPVIKDILTRGLTKKEFTAIFIDEKIKTWGQLLNTKDKTNLVVFTRSDACGAAETWAKYLGKKQENIQGVGVFGDPGMADAIKREPKSIGFNNINYAYDNKSKKPHEGIAIVPIDINENGKIDPEENFYATIDEVTEAIKAGKYPSPPARELFFVSNGKPENKEVIAFLKWVLTEGQKYVGQAGYVQLSKEKIEAALKNLE